MKRKHHSHRSDRSGVILLVVLGALTFFSVLVATYLVFANESRDSSFALSQRSTRAPDVNWMMNEAVMMLIRGTNDVNSPFYGEGILDDYYGRDGTLMSVKRMNLFPPAPQFIGNGFVRFPICQADGNTRDATVERINDAYAGRLITFTEGPLQNITFRVMRSIYQTPAGNGEYDDVFVELPQTVFGNTNPAPAAVLSLFYENTADLTVANGPYQFQLNGVPRNSRGLGYDDMVNNIDQTVGDFPQYRQPQNPNQPISGSNQAAGFNLPVALQPNHLGRNVDKSTLVSNGGDFDEGYDAADFNNWFLSQRRADGSVIPSFHRPAAVNYILNQLDWSAASPADFQNITASLSRATFRPLPISPGGFGGSGPAINDRFTGGSNEFALRTAMRPISAGQLDQIARALISGQYDVDNDADGQPDSIWMNLGLPLFTSREGKLLRPLVSPMIEDLTGRLNLNAHSNRRLNPQAAGLNSAQAYWASTLAPFGTTPTSPTAPPHNQRSVFRGLGWGPAEIALPLTSNSGVIADANIRTELALWLNERYRFGEQTLAMPDVPGRTNRDVIDVLRFGYRPPLHRTNLGFGYSVDPFGRGGIAMGRSGHIITAESGGAISAPSAAAPAAPFINEAINNPYESDPRGGLSGDRAALLADLEVILRANDFDSDLLPASLRQRLRRLITLYPEFARSLTTLSASDDSPTSVTDDGQTPFLSLVDLIQSISGTNYTQAQWNQLIAPELRLGRKLDINRPIGNRVDDNGNNVIDEPLEVTRVDNDSNDNNGSGIADELGETSGERNAFASISPSVGTVPGDFVNQPITSPNYTFEEPPVAAGVIPVSGRQLLARHLYVLMMALSRDLDNPATEVEFPSVSTTPPASFDPDLYKARRLAQWAVNAVDFCDPDAINTRFVFDPFPFDANGWLPIPAPGDTLTSPAEASNPERVVWGVEAPQMLFTESVAYHNVNLRDDDRDDDNQKSKTDTINPDDDSDQVRMPQGSLIMELFCPHPVIAGDQESKPGAPQELFVTNAGNGASELDLARSAPLPGGGVGAPVWRIAISERHDGTSAAAPLDPDQQRIDTPDSASFQPEYADELATTTPGTTLQYDRFILFRDFAETDTDPDAAFTRIDNLITAINAPLTTPLDMTAQQIFYAPRFNGDAQTNSDRTLQPGQFLVLAPRHETVFGSKEFMASVPGLPSDQRMVVSQNEGLIQARHDNIRLTPALTGAAGDPYTPALPMVIAAPRPTGWPVPSAANPNLLRNVVGMSISEPLPRGGNYYPQPQYRYNGTEDLDSDGDEDYVLTDAYIDYSDTTTNAVDTPMDVAIGRIPLQGGEPQLGTVSNYCSAFLQRLADPTLPYHPTLNPYRTVDWMTIDLSVYSGEDRPSNISSDGGYNRRSRQRNGEIKTVGGGTAAANALFSYETDFSLPLQTLDTATPEFFQFSTVGGAAHEEHINSSFSFLNTDTPNINQDFVGFTASLGSLGSPMSDGVTGNDRNLPQTPYALQSWLNRPYASHYELLMVPACSQGRLFEEFSFDPAGSPAIFPTRMASAGSLDLNIFNAPFRHLLNFFHSSDTPAAGAEFAKLFDYVHTLPRFRGEIDLINPRRLTSGNPAEEAVLADMRTLLSPPFNFQYDNQRQARVNMNSLTEFPVWAGLMHGHLNALEFTNRAGSPGNADQLSYNRFLRVRKGYGPSAAISRVTGTPPYNYDPANLDARFPTEFAGLFRSATETGKAMDLRSDTNLFRRRPVNGSMLRGFGDLPANDPVSGTPTPTSLFVRAGTQAPQPAGAPLHDRTRNPFMRYQTLMRMPNLATDNSQVFVIRLTIGFFEVDAGTLNLEKEYNADIGQNKRYQATFVVDRSLPVGFVPGEDMNARDIVIFESYAQ